MTAPGAQRNSSFIKQVMEQVRREAESNEALKRDLDSVQKSTSRLRQHGQRQEENFNELNERLQQFSSGTSESLGKWRERFTHSTSSASHRFSQAVDGHEGLRNAVKFVQAGYQSGAAGSRAALDKTRGVLASGIDRASGAVSYISGEEAKTERLRQWKAARDVAAEAAKAKEAAEASPDAQPGQGEEGPAPVADALVVSHSSSWDRFGAGLRDMPFLSSVFDNPFFEQLFGESEIAASIREMREADSRFLLEEFAEDVEYVVAPHIISSYLQGNQEELQKHCGDAAFAAVNASIKARKQQRLTLDTAILAGPNDIELKGAKLMEKGSPCFIWTFNAQQVNCLRDHNGEIVEGAIDDIRTVHYAMAVTRHPELDELDLEYPWQVSELAILGNQPCW